MDNKDNMNQEILSCVGVTVGYENARLCSDIHFTIHKGEYICVLGQSGKGKSALVAALLGVEKLWSGQILYGPGIHKQHIGCLPQDEIPAFDHASVREVVSRGCIHRHKGFFVGKKNRALVETMLARLSILSLAARPISELSGGYRRRVLLARALCGAESLLLLDEPTRGLDVVASRELAAQIAQINREDGLAVMVIGNEGYADATHILHLADTQLFFGTKEEYEKTPAGQMYLAGRVL